MGDSNFPVIYSTLSAIALVERVLPQYDLGEVSHCELWARGLSDIYFVQAERGMFVLRVSHHHWRTAEEVLFELEFLTFLKSKSLPVAAPHFSEMEELAVPIHAPEGLRYASLFPFAPGRISLGDWTPDQSQQLGAVVAQIHNVGQDFSCRHHRKALDLNYLLDESLSAILPCLGDRPRDYDFLAKTAEKIRQALQDLPQEKPIWSVCWGDVHSGNVHFTDQGQLTLFDFDQCGYGWRIFEIGKFFQGALTTGMPRSIREAFVDGYNTQTTFLPEEESTLQSFTQLAYIWSWFISLNHQRIFGNNLLDPHYFTKRIERLKALSSSGWELF